MLSTTKEMKKPQKGELELKFLMESKVSRIDSSFLSLFMIFYRVGVAQRGAASIKRRMRDLK